MSAQLQRYCGACVAQRYRVNHRGADAYVTNSTGLQSTVICGICTCGMLTRTVCVWPCANAHTNMCRAGASESIATVTVMSSSLCGATLALAGSTRTSGESAVMVRAAGARLGSSRAGPESQCRPRA